MDLSATIIYRSRIVLPDCRNNPGFLPKTFEGGHMVYTNDIKRRSVLEAFEASCMPEPNSGCWLWLGSRFRHRHGYGAFTCRPHGIIQQRAHRIAWKLFRGDVDPARHVLHRCDNPSCVNPDHLFLGDQASNMKDKVRKGRQNRGHNHNFAKLTEDQARSILSDRRDADAIACEFEISRATVQDIKSGRSWRHIRVA